MARIGGHGPTTTDVQIDVLIPEVSRSLAAATNGPQQVAAERYASLEGAELVAILGSWAARMYGEAGPMPNDIDVLIVGDVDEMAADLIAVNAGRETGGGNQPSGREFAALGCLLRWLYCRYPPAPHSPPHPVRHSPGAVRAAEGALLSLSVE